MRRIAITRSQREFFHRHGFLVLNRERIISDNKLISGLHGSFERCFRGEFSTGLYPDEWHWRAGISKDHAVREICNGWKSDALVSSVVQSEEVGALGGMLYDSWKSARVGQDDLLWKVPCKQDIITGQEDDQTIKFKTTEASVAHVGYHIDGDYISSQFVPNEGVSITVWIALDDADEENGVVEYVAGSHRLSTKCRAAILAQSSFHGDDANSLSQDGDGESIADAKRRMVDAVVQAGRDHHQNHDNVQNQDQNEPRFGEVVRPTVPAGCCVIHHESVLHGSGANRSKTRHRRSLVVHLIDGCVQFRDKPDYIYGRYKLADSKELRSEFFPVTWSSDSTI